MILLKFVVLLTSACRRLFLQNRNFTLYHSSKSLRICLQAYIVTAKVLQNQAQLSRNLLCCLFNFQQKFKTRQPTKVWFLETLISFAIIIQNILPLAP